MPLFGDRSSRARRNRSNNNVSQVHFVEEANTLLGTATDATTPITKAVENARSVSDKLTAIRAGRLIIEPPLSHEQFVDFESRAGTIITIGEKATGALAEVEQASTQARSETAQSFTGTGSGGKS